MFDFCHHCGNSIEQNQTVGQTLVCRTCGETIGVVSVPEQKKMIDGTQEAIASSTAARCSLCSQAVQVKMSGGVRSFVPHFVAGGPRKMCPNSGKPVPASAAPAAAPPPLNVPPPPERRLVMSSGKDLTAHMNREVIRVIACTRDGEPTIEQFTLEYLDKSDRVRLQIEALRDLLGAKFQMKAYPAALKRPHLGIWATPTLCVIARKHDQGGYQVMSDADLLQVVEDVRRNRAIFW